MKNSCKVIEKRILYYLNKSRRKRKLSKLESNRGLIHLSRKHSSKMARRRRLWHGNNVSKAGDYISTSILAWLFSFSGGVSGENVAMMPKGRIKGHKRKIHSDRDIAKALHKCWMKSHGHRRNILNSTFTKVGIGVKRKRNTFYATQLFYG